MAHIPVAPHAAGGSAVDPLADLQRLMDPYSVPPEHSHYLMKLLLARLPQNRKEELSVHLFPKALDLMTQNRLWNELSPFNPTWSKLKLPPQEHQAIQTSDIQLHDPHVEDPLTNVALRRGGEFNNEQTLNLLKLLLARLPTHLRHKVSPVLQTCCNMLNNRGTSQERGRGRGGYGDRTRPGGYSDRGNVGRGGNGGGRSGRFSSAAPVTTTTGLDWSAPPAKEVPQKVDDWAARPARGNNFAAPPPAVTANTDWSAPPPASENTNWSEAPSVTANTDWSASPTSNDVRPPAANVPVAVDDWSAPPAPTKLVVPEARQPALAKPTESIPQDFDWGTKSEESVVSAVPVAVASQPVPPAQSRPSDYSPLKPNYNSNDNSRNGYVEQYRQPPPQEELPAQKVDFSNFDWSSPATPPATPVVRNSPRLAPSSGGTPNYDQRTPQQGDHDRSRSASNNAGSEDSRRGGRGGFRGRGGYNNGYSNGGESNDNRSQQYSNDNSRGGGTGGWNNGYSGDTPRGAHRGGSYRGGRGGYNTYNGNSGAYGHNDPQQSQSNNGDLSSASPPAAAAQASPAPVPYTNKFIGENGVPYSPPLGTVFTEPLPDLTDFDWSSGPGRN